MTGTTGTQTEQDADTGESLEKTYTKEQVEARIEQRVERLLEKQAREQKAAKDQARQDTLAAEAKWKELAELGQAKVAELEPLVAQVEAYGKLIAGMLKEKVKGLGDAAKKAIGALPESMTALEKLAWLNENEELFQAETNRVVGTPKGSKKAAKGKSYAHEPVKR